MKTIIHVNQHNIKANAKGASLPVLTVKTYKANSYANTISINGPWQVYRMRKPFTKHYVSNQKEGVALMKSWVGEFHIPAGVKL